MGAVAGSEAKGGSSWMAGGAAFEALLNSGCWMPCAPVERYACLLCILSSAAGVSCAATSGFAHKKNSKQGRLTTSHSQFVSFLHKT